MKRDVFASAFLFSLIVLSGAFGVEDDEIHDREILRSVITSVRQWQQRKSNHRVKRDEEIVCYGELGCFRDEGPFDYLDTLPSPPEEIDTRFFFFTRNTEEIFSYFNYTLIAQPVYNSSNPTKVIIHGFGSTCSREWAHEMRAALLTVEDCNVVCVDWENGAAIPNYVRAAANTRLVGKQVAHLLLWLRERLGSRTEDFHLIGFSLGAHVAGFTGQEVKNISRITGLDPAGPLFESYDHRVRLDSSDANFVDVIHSNGDSLLMGGLGSWEPMGHVDFYPNGGRVQKGCSNLFLGAVRDFLWSASNGDGRSLCNHRRAYKFFTESVSPHCPFPAFSCESYEKFLTGACWDVNRSCNMGYYADRNAKKGLLYLVTRDEEPFCANQFRLTIESSPSAAPISTYGGIEAIIISKNLNESFVVTQSLKDNMVAGSVLQRMVVANPAITDPIKIQLKYTAYQGWLYSGISRWSMDRLIVMSAFGKSVSFCTRGLLLPSGIPVTVTLTPGICTNGFLPSSRPIYYPYENLLAPVVSPEGNHLPENSSEVIDFSYPLDKQEANKTEVKIKICQLVEVNSTLECNEWNNTIPKYEAADPDVILPPQLQYILYQLESAGLGHLQNKSSSSKVITRPTPLSRALKGRVVLLPGRKGRNFDFVHNGSLNGATSAAGGPNGQVDFLYERHVHHHPPLQSPGPLPPPPPNNNNNVHLNLNGHAPIVHGVIHNNQLIRSDNSPSMKNVHISVPLKDLQQQQPHKYPPSPLSPPSYMQQQQHNIHSLQQAPHPPGSEFISKLSFPPQVSLSPSHSVHLTHHGSNNVIVGMQKSNNNNNNKMSGINPGERQTPSSPSSGNLVMNHNNNNNNQQQQQQQSAATAAAMHNVPTPLQQSHSVQNIPFQLQTGQSHGQSHGQSLPTPPIAPPTSQQSTLNIVHPPSPQQQQQQQQHAINNGQSVPPPPPASNQQQQHAGQMVTTASDISSSPVIPVLQPNVQQQQQQQFLVHSTNVNVKSNNPLETNVQNIGNLVHENILAQEKSFRVEQGPQTVVVVNDGGNVGPSLSMSVVSAPSPLQQQQQQQQMGNNVQQSIPVQQTTGPLNPPSGPLQPNVGHLHDTSNHHPQQQQQQHHQSKDLNQRSYTRRPYRKGGHVTTKGGGGGGYYIVPFFRPARRNAKLFYDDRYRN